jgi:hypothetical protein
LLPQEWPPQTSAFHHARRGSGEGPFALYQIAPELVREDAANQVEYPTLQPGHLQSSQGRNAPLFCFQ